MGDVTKEFAKLMVTLAEGYGTKLTEGRIRMYAAALGDLPVPQVEAAMLRAVKECTYFPTVAELRKFVEPTADDAALIAWTAAGRAAAAVGAYASIQVEDRAAAVALITVFGSWPAFCEVAGDSPAMHAKRQEFLAAYRAARRERRDGPTTLAGLCQATGQYAEKSWTGRIALSGEVSAEPAPLALAAREPKQLKP